MGDVVNLNKKRKAQTKVADVARAAENRVKHGRTKQEKLADKLKAEKLARHVDAHKRDTPDA